MISQRRFLEQMSRPYGLELFLTRPLSWLYRFVGREDFFKLYNHTYGHQAEDDCLRNVTGAIQNVVKRSTGLVARDGGEESAVIVSFTPTTQAIHLAESIRQGARALAIPHRHSLVSGCVTVSVGVASILATPEK